MNREPIRVTEAGVLRAQFTDTVNEGIEATNVEVNLYAPGLTPGEDSPTVSGLAPVHMGQGVFQLSFVAQAPGGTWIDEWTGDILGSSTTARFTFEVLSSGYAVSYPVFGVCQNNLVEITVASGVRATSGALLEDEYSFFFTTEYFPLYANPRKVRLEAGGLLGNVPDYTLYSALLEASIEADTITFANTITNNALYQHARREYVACKAGMVVGSNLLATGGVLKSKRLADFHVEYDRGSLENLLDQMHANCKRWLAQIEAGGGARAIRDPKMVVKGDLDPDRPAIGRGWKEVGSNELPIGNRRELPAGRRRWHKTHKRPRGWNDW